MWVNITKDYYGRSKIVSIPGTLSSGEEQNVTIRINGPTDKIVNVNQTTTNVKED